MRQVSDDPVVRAKGYLWAADGNLRTALYLLPVGHPEAEKLAKLVKQVKKMYDRLSDVNP